jgi:hypothetical protein
MCKQDWISLKVTLEPSLLMNIDLPGRCVSTNVSLYL